MSSSPASALERLQTWYASNCDQVWEHSFGIKIETIDNPGWLVHIDIEQTNLVNVPFASVQIGDWNGLKRERQVGSWMDCRVHEKSPYVRHEGRGRVWIGACSADWLERLLTAFLDWAEAAPRSSRGSIS